MAAPDQKQLLLKVDASVELARRNLATLEQSVARDATKMDASLSRIDAAAGRAGAAFGVLKANATAFVAGIGISTVVAFGKSILDFADDLGTAADQAGVGVERYQTLREAFRALEISTEQTDKVLKTLQDTLGAVQSGADSGATKALDRLGVSAAVMSGKITTSDQLLDAIAASAKTAGSEAQFTADIVDIFGKKVGVDLAAALRDGGVALHQLEADMKATGQVVSEELVQKLADANEQIDRVFTTMKQNAVLWAGETISAIQRAGKWWQWYHNQIVQASPLAPQGDKNRAYGENYAGMAPEAQLAETRRQLDARRATLAAARKQAGGRFNLATGSVEGGALLPGVVAAERSVANLEKIEKRQVAAIDRLRTNQSRLLAAGIDPNNLPAADVPIPRFGKSAKIDKPKAAAKASTPKSAPDVIDPRAGISVLNSPLLGSLKDGEFQDVTAYLKAVQDGIDKQRDAEADLFRQGESRVRDLAGLFEDALTRRAGSFWSQFKQLGLGVVSQIAARLLTANGGAGGGFGSILKSSASSVLGGLFSGRGFAAGGDPPMGKFSVVGERGPELFIPKVPGTIIPNHALGGGAPRSLSLTMTVTGVSNRAEMEAIGIRAGQAAYQAAVATQGKTLQALGRPQLASSMG